MKLVSCPICNCRMSFRDDHRRKRKVCSRKCALILARKVNPVIGHAAWVKCGFCGKSIRAEMARVKHSKSGKVYCNKSCKAKAEIPKKSVILECETCGKVLVRSPCHLEHKHHFCCRQCFGIWRRQFTGEQALHWKGGYNKTERERIRSRKAWKELRKTVLESFSKACAVCGKTGTLHLHHIRPWRLGGKDEISNLVPLCPKCHSKQTVSDWIVENGVSWKVGGAHVYRKAGDYNDGDRLCKIG